MKKVLYFTVFCALISCGNSQNSAVMQITPYYNVDSLIRSQVALLDSKRPSLEKRAWLKDEPDTITFSPDSAEWGRELEIFLQIDLNKPVLRDAYTVSNETGPEGEKIVAYIAKEAEDVQVDHHEEEAGAVGMRITQRPAPVHVAHDVLDRAERDSGVGRVVHRQDDAGDQLERQRKAGQDTEVPPVVKIARHRVAGAHGIIDEARQRQLLVQVPHQRRLGFVLLGPGKAHQADSCPITIVVSEVKV